ncbi:hypothetical protein ACRALDRAFT_2015870 [Sodiomyces alcalophilus JCM 7366]|uniref:uncharacterized protein n=1 Tax=Sodiomyces alcalophilus JCM 7366 TaxID=591952 RepID=UPI0039B5D9BB
MFYQVLERCRAGYVRALCVGRQFDRHPVMSPRETIKCRHDPALHWSYNSLGIINGKVIRASLACHLKSGEQRCDRESPAKGIEPLPSWKQNQATPDVRYEVFVPTNTVSTSSLVQTLF